MAAPAHRDRITIAILALGGQGGGVLADWIVALGERSGYVAQATSVPGVAQRTGSTVYYVELFPASTAGARAPVLALMPAPGDVDIVIASELMETGRAILRGFATERTILIGSTHRIYAISERSALGDGRTSGARILEAARTRCARFIGFDMDDIAERTGSRISSVMFGALAGSGALSSPRAAFEAAIRDSGTAVDASLRAFAAGFEASRGPPESLAVEPARAPEPTTAAGAELADRIGATLPELARAVAREGVKRLMDYQDRRYAELYLDRLGRIADADTAGDSGRLTALTAKHLALWMSYEDTIRVADLKIRDSRMTRVRKEVMAPADAIVAVTEYMHPRTQEICEMLPAGLGRRLLASGRVRLILDRLFSKGRHVRTTAIGWFLILSFLAALRPMRRGTLRYTVEQARIEAWLDLVEDAARAADHDCAGELAQCQRIIKGYGETHARGLANYQRIVAQWPRLKGTPGAAAALQRLRDAALADEDGKALSETLDRLAA